MVYEPLRRLLRVHLSALRDGLIHVLFVHLRVLRRWNPGAGNRLEIEVTRDENPNEERGASAPS
jgi:hypothetical protein